MRTRRKGRWSRPTCQRARPAVVWVALIGVRLNPMMIQLTVALQARARWARKDALIIKGLNKAPDYLLVRRHLTS